MERRANTRRINVVFPQPGNPVNKIVLPIENYLVKHIKHKKYVPTRGTLPVTFKAAELDA
jgi:hypothetical protein